MCDIPFIQSGFIFFENVTGNLLGKTPALGDEAKLARTEKTQTRPLQGQWETPLRENQTFNYTVVARLREKHKLLFSDCRAVFSARVSQLVIIVACW
jgi:hypothetical protein